MSVLPTGKTKKPSRKETSLSATATENAERSPGCEYCSGKHELHMCKTFAGVTLEKKYGCLKKHFLCFNCLQTGHAARQCKQSTCSHCHKRHHILLHTKGGEGGGLSKKPEVTALANSAVSRPLVLLATVMVEARTISGDFVPVRAILDTGSQSSFVTNRCCQRLGLACAPTNTRVSGLGRGPTHVTREVGMEVRSRYGGGGSFVLEALVLPKICGPVPTCKVDPRCWMLNSGLALADPSFAVPGPVDVLLGADLVGRVVSGRRREGPPGEPVALETSFGWVFLGKVLTQDATSDSIVLHATVEPDLESVVQRFWQLDHFPTIVGPQGCRDREVDQLFADTYTRDQDGRFTVALPFKAEQPTFRGSKRLAERRFFLLERRFLRDDALRLEYQAFMADYLNSGHMSLVTEEDASAYYIPHHAVKKPGSQTTKLRVVFDASARDLNGHSLNDCMELGPPLQRSILAILLRFRCQAVGFMADVKQMYRQIWIREEDRRFQRILWRAHPDLPLQEYQLNTVTYGIASSPYLAQRCLQELAWREGERWPRAAQALLSDTYMDDIVSGSSNIPEAGSLQSDLIQLLHAGGFELRKWACNEAALLENLDHNVEHQIAMPACGGEEPFLKVLGMRWDPLGDRFSYGIQIEVHLCTKRSVLSDLAKVFDPLGFLCPVVFLAKFWIQCLWVLQLDWDDPVPTEMEEKWKSWQSELSVLQELQIPRFVLAETTETPQIHGFCDASERGYAAVVYVRSVAADGEVQVRILVAKSRVAPLKRRTIPRLELCAAVLLADLLVEVRKEGSAWFENAPIVAWSDSMVVLSWLRTQSSGYRPFVGNRVGHVQETIGAECFRHVPTASNPADVASRGALPTDLRSHGLWWQGPSWLTQPEDQWPAQKTTTELNGVGDPAECRTVCLVNEVTGFLWWDRWSKLSMLVGVIAWIFRFTTNCRAKRAGKPVAQGVLQAFERRQALEVLIVKMQQQVFKEAIKRLKAGNRVEAAIRALNPFLDEKGVLRVGGRLKHADLDYQTKYPILLPRQHQLTNLIIWDVHLRFCHPGLQTLLHLLRQNFWILSARRAIKSCLRQCIACFRVCPRPVTPKMGDLPPSRVLEAKAFLHVGIDMGGPFLVRPVPGRGRHRQAQKLYICVFVCQVTKAIHIEVVFDLTAEAFIAALRRFVARRGHCAHITCDNGTNFVGGSRMLGRLWRQVSDAQQIRFDFNPAGAPHFGGAFEAGIKSVKTHLHRVAGAHSLTLEEFITLLAQVEALLNSRPLWQTSSDANDFTALTPGHFLLLEPLTVLPDPDLTGRPMNTLSRWQLVQRLQRGFWDRWRREYLTTLHQRQKWTQDQAPLLEGSLVLVKDDTKPLLWELARISKLHFGADGIARVATLNSSRGRFQRPAVKLCPLPGAATSS